MLWHAVVRILSLSSPLLLRIGLTRLERPVARVESVLKGALLDCRMCGQCVLSDTGMSCPMNCPREIRNGPRGGVRADGGCVVRPDMPCVRAKGYEGTRWTRHGDGIATVQ